MLHQQSCNGQEACDRVVVLDLIPWEELLTMPPERVNAILRAFNEGRTLEEAARLANEFLGMLGYIRAACIYSATAADDDGLSDTATQNNVLSDKSIQINLLLMALGQALVTPD
jgi:hypothetical protein